MVKGGKEGCAPLNALFVVGARQVPFDLMVSPSVLLLGTLSYKQVFKPC